jgi:hypothetical protein
MNGTKLTLPAEAGGTEITRLNALRHGVLSRYTVLPWEDAEEYSTLVAALAAEHAPQGPTEEHLVEELAGILWRKRRLRLAEAAAHHRGLEDTLSPFRGTKEAALAYVGVSNPSEQEGTGEPAANPRAGIRRGARSRQAGAARPL